MPIERPYGDDESRRRCRGLMHIHASGLRCLSQAADAIDCPDQDRRMTIVAFHTAAGRRQCYCVNLGAIYNCRRSLYFPA